MKKLISIILSAVMILSMSIPVFAAETPNTHFRFLPLLFPMPISSQKLHLQL